MIRTKIFQKYFVLALTMLIAFVFFGFYFNFLMMQLIQPRVEIVPPLFLAKIVDRIGPVDKAKAVAELNSWHNDKPGTNFILLNEHGIAIYPTDYKIDFNWLEVKKPENAYDYTYVQSNQSTPKPPSFFMPGPPPFRTALVRLDNKESLFLLIPPPSFPFGKKPASLFPFIGLISLIVSLCLGVGVTISIIYYSVKKNVSIADHVISELRQGNLKARFPINRKDEFGHAMMRFNYMADEIEKLVTDLRTVEHARTKLLQELAHDLRTPIASLKNLIETLDSEDKKIDPAVRKELMGLSLKEIDYFEHLVEDLLFLARVKEPAYQTEQQSFDLTEILMEESDSLALRYDHQGKKINIIGLQRNSGFLFKGDVHLFRRLFRNALENAFSFAKSKVTIQIEKLTESSIFINILDDGPGLNQESIEAFGHRRISRKLETHPKGRLSVGLGSVVMKTICEVHRGQIRITNNLNSSGDKLGAKLTIELPIN